MLDIGGGWTSRSCQDVKTLETWLNCKKYIQSQLGYFTPWKINMKTPKLEVWKMVLLFILVISWFRVVGVPFRSVPPSKGLSMNFECVQPAKKEMSSCGQATPPLFNLM